MVELRHLVEHWLIAVLFVALPLSTMTTFASAADVPTLVRTSQDAVVLVTSLDKQGKPKHSVVAFSSALMVLL
jgi:hypothetical protein